MVSRPHDTEAVPAKIVITGAFGAGKTTFVHTVSETPVVNTEETITIWDGGVAAPGKATATVELDYGSRIFAAEKVALHLFGAPGHPRSSFIWNDVARGALGAVVLADSRRVEDAYSAMSFLEEHKLGFVVAFNGAGADRPPVRHARELLELAPQVPVLACDARDPASALLVLRTLVQYTLDSAAAPVEEN